jgi:transposase
MNRTLLTDNQWALILPFLMAHPRAYVGNANACRDFLNGALWVLWSGSQWRLLPEGQGAWNSVFKRFSRWQLHGVWADLLAHVASDSDLQHLLIDSTVVCVHPCAAGAEGSSAELKALRRSRGGFSTKIHAVTDALGNPLAFVLTGGQASDIGQAERLIGDFPAEAVIGDKGYDSELSSLSLDTHDRTPNTHRESASKVHKFPP